MLIVVSDLHLLDETAGRHNPSPDAFERVFFPHIVALARANGAKEIKLLLLGDLFELLRTEHWLEIAPEDRPWGERGLADIRELRMNGATEQQCLAILGVMPADGSKESVNQNTILYRNWESLRFLREFRDRLHEELDADIPITTIYVPGNHDRLANLYPSLRDAIRDIVNVTVSSSTVQGDPQGEWWFLNDYVDEEHGVFARHGQQYDPLNYGGGNDFTRMGHLQVPIGDPLAVEFATKLPYRLSLYREEEPGITAEFVEFMKEMGLVRPFTHAMQWLYFAIKSQDQGNVRKILDRVFDEVVSEILDLNFVQSWRSPATRLDEAIRLASSRWLRWIPKALLDRLDAEELLPFFMGVAQNPRDPEQDKLLIAAYNEHRWRENDRIRFILYGHTHMPEQRPLDAEEGREVMYLNTGTWRDSIFRTTIHDRDPDFVKLTQITYTIFYREDENTDDKGLRSIGFETWSGMKKMVRIQ